MKSGGNYMAKKRKAKKGKIKSKRAAKNNNAKKRSSRKPGLRVVATSEKEEAEIPQARTPHDIFEGINGRSAKVRSGAERMARLFRGESCDGV
jgi:hypothetical protein